MLMNLDRRYRKYRRQRCDSLEKLLDISSKDYIANKGMRNKSMQTIEITLFTLNRCKSKWNGDVS